jgi:RecA-family ATPase
MSAVAEEPQASDLLKAMLRLHKRGLSPIPIVPGEKRPSINGWEKYCDSQPAVERLVAWASNFPNAGVGVALGTIVDKDRDLRLVAIDIDDDAFVEAVKVIVFEANSDALYVAKKGNRGITFFALSNGPMPGLKLKSVSGMAVELLSRGQQSVIPPSVHPTTGRPYEWKGERTLFDANVVTSLPVMTEELWERIRKSVTAVQPRPASDLVPAEFLTPESFPIRYLGDGKFEGVSMTYPGDVNDTGWKMAGAAAWHNWTNDLLDERSRDMVINSIVDHAFEALRKSGASEHWDRERQVREATSQYDRQIEGLRKRLSPANDGSAKRTSSLNLICPADFQDQPVPERRWLVSGWIVSGHVVALYGDGGIGKSLLALQLMTSCATGRSWLGLKTEPCKVFGLFCEDDADELKRRQREINRAYGIDYRDLKGMVWLCRVGEDNLLMRFAGEGGGFQTKLLRDLVNYLTEYKPGLIVIDTAADTFGGNENIRGQVRQFIATALGGLAKASGATVLLLAHPSRSGLQTGSGDGGSTAWNNSVRARLYLQRVDSGGPTQGLGDRVLSRKKSNYGPVDGEAIPLAWKDGAFVPMGSSDAASALVARAEWQEAFLAALDDVSAQGSWVSRSVNSARYAPRVMALMPAAQNLSEAQLKAVMDDLVANGRLREVEDGPPSKRRYKLVRGLQPQRLEQVEEEVLRP